MIEIVIAGVSLTVGVISIFTSYSKLQSVLSRLETRDLELREQIQQIQLRLEHQTDRTELLFNGLKERAEHTKSRFATELERLTSLITDLENYLQKNTSYERRAR